jgi:hypothetical protein
MKSENLQSPDRLNSLSEGGSNFISDLWNSRRFLSFVAALCACLILALAYFSAKFNSEGLFQLFIPVYRTPEASATISIAQPSFTEFKRILSAVSEESRFNNYLSARNLSTKIELASLAPLVAKRTELSRLLEPQFAISRNDAKDLVDLGIKENATQIIGVKVFPGADSPGAANARAVALAEYVRDTAFHLMISDYARAKESELRQQALSLAEQGVGKSYELSLLNKKISSLGIFLKGSGSTSEKDSGQIIGLNDSTTRFLPVQTQLTASKIQSLELSQTLARIERQQAQSALLITYYRSLRIEADRSNTGQSVVEKLPSLLDSAMKTVDPGDEKYEQVRLLLQLEKEKVTGAYEDRSRFISGPSTPTSRSWQPGLVIPVSIFTGIALSILTFVSLRLTRKLRN